MSPIFIRGKRVDLTSDTPCMSNSHTVDSFLKARISVFRAASSLALKLRSPCRLSHDASRFSSAATNCGRPFA